MTATAVVTGAATVVGAATADALAGAGYAVALWDIEAAVKAGAAEITARGRTAIAARVDVSNADSIHAALAAVRGELGTPAAVVSAAGIMAAYPFLELPLEKWDATLRVNLTGTFLLLQVCGAAMVEDAPPGAMVAVASVAARRPRLDGADYAASQGRRGERRAVRGCCHGSASSDLSRDGGR
jgi:NAD(P)-dependent dehydrogenase (short-subunit alcohol dehydrogenase family)